MHRLKFKLIKIAAFTALICLVSLLAMRFQRNAKLNRLGQSLSVSMARSDEDNSQAELNAKYLRDKAFAQLWELRKKVTIDDSIIEYLSHPERNVQARAIIALGQLGVIGGHNTYFSDALNCAPCPVFLALFCPVMLITSRNAACGGATFSSTMATARFICGT